MTAPTRDEFLTMLPTSDFYRDGLFYHLHSDPEPHYRLTAAHRFAVDEIWYDHDAAAESDAVYTRPMIEVIDDKELNEATACINFSAQLTEAELDHYVEYGFLPSPPPEGTPHNGHQTR